jgi:hypothetical protein
MIISDRKNIHQIQDEFNELFPGLRIKFYTKYHDHYDYSSMADLYNNDAKIGDIRKVNNEEDLALNPKSTVGQIEKVFRSKYGLNVQIFRRSKDTWLQTFTTDDWTLERQNSKGILSSDSYFQLYSKKDNLG